MYVNLYAAPCTIACKSKVESLDKNFFEGSLVFFFSRFIIIIIVFPSLEN